MAKKKVDRVPAAVLRMPGGGELRVYGANVEFAYKPDSDVEAHATEVGAKFPVRCEGHITIDKK